MPTPPFSITDEIFKPPIPGSPHEKCWWRREYRNIGNYNMANSESNIIIYNTIDGKASVVLYAHVGSVWMKNAINRSLWDKNQNQLAELFDTSKQTISYHVLNILNERELSADSVVKDYLTTVSDGKQYEVINSRSFGR